MRNDPHPIPGGESLLFLTDEQIRRGIEAMYFAYRAFTSDPDLILAEIGYGRAHHRALYFIHRDSGLTVTALLEVLGVTKQSLNRVLRTLIEDGLVDSRVGRRDRRERELYLTHKGAALERRLSESQRARMRAAFRGAFVLNSDYDGVRGQATLDAGEADAIAFGRTFIANPDLVERIAKGAPLNKDVQATWYSQGPEGYVDYPTQGAAKAA